MARFTTTLLSAVFFIATITNAQQCTGNQSSCPGGVDGQSPTYLQCNGGSYVAMNCPSGQVCYANPNKPGTAMCGLPGTGGIPGGGSCTGNVAKCDSPGTSGSYKQCENWSGRYVQASCPGTLKCYNNASNTGVYCN